LNRHNLTSHARLSLPIETSDEHNSVENRVIRQLLEALLFEKICDFEHQLGYFEFILGEHSYRVQGNVSGFSRVRINSSDMQYRVGDNWQKVSLAHLIADLPTEQSVKNRLRLELDQTIKLSCWNQHNLDRIVNRRELNYNELESAIDEGHPYHPCFKARIGFSEKDHQCYGPESAQHFQLHWLAVRRCYLKRRFNLLSETLFWQQELGNDHLHTLQQQLTQQTDDVTAFSLMPIHPWQWQNIQEQLQTALSKQQLFYLGAAGDLYQASISVRTLLNVSAPNKANIKLPLNIMNTSSLRTIESHSICTAPDISNWLMKLYNNDNYLQEKMVLLEEYAGIRIANDGPEHQNWIANLTDQLGVIFRESLTNYCSPQHSLPFLALTVIEQDNKPFIDPWIKHYGCQQWLKQLIETAIIPVWHLLVHHGIAIEAHGQNMLIEHKQGWPYKVIIRDFHESLEYVESYLAKPELAPIFTELESCYEQGQPDQYYWMSSVEALRELLVDTLFVFNLTDLAVMLEHHYQFSEQKFWRTVYQAIVTYQKSGLTSPERLAKIEIFKPKINTESLLKKKFDGNRAAEYHHTVDNPLASAQQEAAPGNSGTVLKEIENKTPCFQ